MSVSGAYIHDNEILTFINAPIATELTANFFPIYCNHYCTVQVAVCAYSFVCTLVNALVLQGKTLPEQVAVDDDFHECMQVEYLH